MWFVVTKGATRKNWVGMNKVPGRTTETARGGEGVFFFPSFLSFVSRLFLFLFW